jgi:hypothetical protein
MTAERRFPAPWTVEEYRGISYIVRDANDFAVAYVYFESEPGRRAAAKLMTKDEARKIANGIAKLPSCCDQAKNKSPLYAARLNGGRIGELGGWGNGSPSLAIIPTPVIWSQKN